MIDRIREFERDMNALYQAKINKANQELVDSLQTAALSGLEPQLIKKVGLEISDNDRKVESFEEILSNSLYGAETYERRYGEPGLIGRLEARNLITSEDLGSTSTIEEEPDEDEEFKDKEPNLYYPTNLFVVKEPDIYLDVLNGVLLQGLTSSQWQTEFTSEARQGLVNAGILLNRRVKLFPQNTHTNPAGLIEFEIGKSNESLSLDNIDCLRNNLGRISVFGSLPKELLDTGIDGLGLSSRTFNRLARNQVATIRQVVSFTEFELDGLRNFGKSLYQELVVALVDKGVLPKVEESRENSVRSDEFFDGVSVTFN